MEKSFNQLDIDQQIIIMSISMIKEYLHNIQSNGYYEVLDVQQHFVDFLLYLGKIEEAHEIKSFMITCNNIPNID